MSSDNVSVKALTGQGAPAFRIFAKAGPVHSSRQISGYVVMPEHVHLLLGEPERGTLALSLQMMNQCVSRKLNAKSAKHPLWLPRYYDFDVWSEYKHVEKLRYIQPNPATSRAVAHFAVEHLAVERRLGHFIHYSKEILCLVLIEGDRGMINFLRTSVRLRRRHLSIDSRRRHSSSCTSSLAWTCPMRHRRALQKQFPWNGT